MPSDRKHIALEAGQYAVVDVSSSYSPPRFLTVQVLKVTDKTVVYPSPFSPKNTTFSSRHRAVFAGSQLECDSLASILKESVAEEWKATRALRDSAWEDRKRFIDKAMEGQRS